MALPFRSPSCPRRSIPPAATLAFAVYVAGEFNLDWVKFDASFSTGAARAGCVPGGEPDRRPQAGLLRLNQN